VLLNAQRFIYKPLSITKKMKIKGIIIIGFLLILNNCTIKKYYFQISDFNDSKIYKYECKSKSNKTQYWKLTSNETDNTLITEAFKSNFKQYEYFKEKFTKNGSKLLEFISFRYDNNDKKMEIIKIPIELDVYKWKTEKPYKYSVEYVEKNYGKIIFQKERRYIGKEVILVFGKKYNAIKLEGIYKTKVISTNQVYEYKQFSYYVKGFGLVKMEKKFPNGKKETFELTEIMTEIEWKKSQ